MNLTLSMLVNAVITFTIAVSPIIIVYASIQHSQRSASRGIVKHLSFSCIAVYSFSLVLFSIYKSESIARTFLHLCQKINIKFLAAVLTINIFILGVLRLGRIAIKPGKISVSKPILAVILIPLLLITGSVRFRDVFGIVPVEQLIFHATAANSGANFSMVYRIIAETAIDAAILFILLMVLLSLRITFKKSNKVFLFHSRKKQEWIAVVLFCIAGTGFCIMNIDAPDYIASLRQGPSSFYEEHYIDPNGVEIIFPEQKRNLIVIFVESLETGFLTQQDGGAFSESLIPDIENLMKTNINFSPDKGPGGSHELYGTEWTIAGITAQYSGIPLAVAFVDQTPWNNYGALGDEFLPGASGVGDILYRAGYTNYFILGSEIEFASRDKYFRTHKDTIIYDYQYFYDHGYIPEDYRVWWGIEDRKLYRFAKEKITEAADKEPFFITLLTVDTHPSDGYLDAEAESIFDSRYKNVLFDASRQLADFLKWLEEQPFYENTTVVVLGDHLYQDSSFFPDDFQIHSLSSRYEASYNRDEPNNKYNRFPVNIFINSLLNEEHTKNRIFSHFDIFPALIDSIGAVYNAEGLALGRSMNKGEKTLLEILGVDE
ncbi:MAG: LTA synthase family protein, partial [Treponema sp.]|nr:LTA synthase family protein [Treponema sp.]